jgi:hypothetical protein
VDSNGQAHKLLLTFDPIPGQREEYLNYVLGEFVPTLEHLGLKMCEAWHTAYGEYPLRLTAFIAQDAAALEQIVASKDFQDLERRLQDYVVNYHRRIVPLQRHFQF